MAYNIFKLHREGVPPLLDGIETKEQFREKIQRIRDIWLDYIGGVPERVPVRYEVLGEMVSNDHIRRHIVYDTVHGDKITAYLLLPLNKERTAVLPGRLPAVLALHPTSEIGKRGVCLPEGKPDHVYGMELVSRGYVVLAPDAMTSGERIEVGYNYFNSVPFYLRHLGWSTVGKNIVDHMQGVDFLCEQNFVDADRIGVIGHSFGGYNSYFLAGMDSRIKAVVSSCGLSPFAKDDKPTHWGRRETARQAGASSYTHLPRVTDDLSRGMVPFDFHEIIALAAPAPFMNYSAQSDAIFPHWQSIGDVTKDLYGLYKWLGYGDRFLSLMGAKEHSFPPEIRKAAYDFLDRWLLNERNG
ncbi:dipeptidyl aminopeptidase [Paenibacillus mesophilus]|uniref:alpha/beta hydrolase family protein n=1 Tax=Paenibacillus mesophilus TaxID=2582849 RepID=UPI00110F0107|nr:prolyl oligopeptidase family serine peptidase [Paenibacillus mesophilus]TMV49911.1 dipeptidyl aminopeptidase [Paenibacillus mesophilus]